MYGASSAPCFYFWLEIANAISSVEITRQPAGASGPKRSGGMGGGGRGGYTNTMYYRLLFCMLVIVLILADQILKFRHLGVDAVINSDLAFGLPIINIAATWVVMAVLFGVAICARHAFLRRLFSDAMAYITIVLAGASNVVDRFRFGGVVDYIHARPWPSFNLAEGLIVLAVVFLVGRALRVAASTTFSRR